MKRILVPVDFSKEAEAAARVAAKIAKKTNSEIFLVHMLELPVSTIDPAEMNTISSEPQIIYFMKLAHKKFETFKKLSFFKGLRVIETVQFQHAFSGAKAPPRAPCGTSTTT